MDSPHSLALLCANRISGCTRERHTVSRTVLPFLRPAAATPLEQPRSSPRQPAQIDNLSFDNLSFDNLNSCSSSSGSCFGKRGKRSHCAGKRGCITARETATLGRVSEREGRLFGETGRVDYTTWNQGGGAEESSDRGADIR